MKARTVLLVEDDGPTRERLAGVIRGRSELSLQAACSCALEAREALAQAFPDILLTDLGLPDGNGIDLIREATRANPQTEAMVITVFSDERNVLAAIEAGASGYLLKDASADEIQRAIDDLLAGGAPMSPSIARHVLRRLRTQDNGPDAAKVDAVAADTPKLTKREREVLELLVKGFTYNEAGKLLNIAESTVTSHIRSIYRKLDVGSRGEAVFEAAQLGLVQLKS